MIGNNTTMLKGEGYDFVELREYEDGEDVKKIDWTISAKMQKPYVKVFHSQRELNISIVPIMSGSLYFGTSKFKQDVVAEITAILGYSCVKQSDSFDSFIVNDTVNLNTKRTKRMFAVNKMVENIYTYDVINKNVNYEIIINQLYKQIRKKSMIFLIGDFFDIKNIDLRVLAKKHELIALIIRDKYEEDPKSMGDVNFIDPQNNESFQGEMSKSLINEYKKQVKENDHHLYEHFQKCGIRFTKIYTHEEPLQKLIPLMSH